MIRTLLLTGIALNFLFAGCTLAPEYVRPAAPVPRQWPTGPAYEARPVATTAPDLDWRSFFSDKGLQQVIAASLENNRDLRIAALNVERARALYHVQRAEMLPTVDAAAKVYRERIPADLSSNGQRMTAEQYSVDLGITAWELDFFGRIRSLSQSALQSYFATEQARRSAQVLLIAEVANAYLTLAADCENLQLARSTLASQQASYHLINSRFEVGLSPELDLHQVQTRVESARVDEARYTLRVAQDENALNLLMGAPVSPALLPTALGKALPLQEITPGVSSEVLLGRPDILAAENLLKAAYADIGAARASLFPRIALTSSVGTASADLSGLFGGGSGTWLFSPQATLPIFDPRTWAALKVNKVDREIALAQYEATIQSAFREVADALAQRGSLQKQLKAQQNIVAATEAAYRISNARYEKGIEIYLSVLDAQRSLYAAQQELIAVRLSDLASQVRLYTVLGGGAV
jgi:multidrug efflux system outer membrane protein